MGRVPDAERARVGVEAAALPESYGSSRNARRDCPARRRGRRFDSQLHRPESGFLRGDDSSWRRATECRLQCNVSLRLDLGRLRLAPGVTCVATVV